MNVSWGLGDRFYGLWGKKVSVILIDLEHSEISSLFKKMTLDYHLF